MLAQVGIGLQFLMQKIKTKISEASIYQFETFFHLDYSSESISSSYSDKDQLSSVAKILKKDSIKSIDITHYNSPPSIIPALEIFILTMESAKANKMFIPKTGLVDGMIKETFFERNGNKLNP